LDEQGILSELKKHSGLKHLSLHMNYHDAFEKFNIPDFRVDVTDFRNLNSLELHHIHGRSPLLAKDIAQCLIGSPNLKALALGLASDVNIESTPESIMLDFYQNILEDLCHLYQDHYNGTPLALHTLRLGYGVIPLKAMPGNDQRYLNKLVKTSGIRVLQIANGLGKSDDITDDDPEAGYDDDSENDTMITPMKISFEQFEDCEALRCLSLTRLHENARIWLNDRRRSTIQELIVEWHTSLHRLLDRLSGELSLPHLSKLFVNEIHGECPAELSVGRSRWNVKNVYGLSNHSILNRLENNGSQLTSLTLTIDLEVQWVYLLFHMTSDWY
jgi:hypothetical protein